MRAFFWFYLFLWFGPSLLLGQRIQRHQRLPAILGEISGLVRGADGHFYALNDGGNAPWLFRLDGNTLRLKDTLALPIPNRDWEDLAADDKGYLYVGDFGNNYNRRRDLCVYRYQLSTHNLDSILFHFSDQTAYPPTDPAARNFDCEAMVFAGDSLHLFTKSRFKSRHWCKHYALPAQPGQYAATLRDSIQLKNRVVSGAGLSQDGQTLALTSYIIRRIWGFLPSTKADVFFFERSGGHFLRSTPKRKRLPKFFIARQFESIVAWAPGVWLAANEAIGPQKAAIWRIRQRR